jgi:hypothetical protein
MVLDPQAQTPIDPALLRSDNEAQASKKSSHKNDTTLSRTVDTTILEAVKSALVAIRRDAIPSQAERHDPGSAPTKASSDADLRNRMFAPAHRRGLEIPTSRTSVQSSTAAPAETNQDELALEVLKIIRSLGFTVHKDMDANTQQPESPQPTIPSKSEKKVSCHICKSFEGRPCELR